MRNFISTLALASAIVACGADEAPKEISQRGSTLSSSVSTETSVRSTEAVPELTAMEEELPPVESAQPEVEEIAANGDPPVGPQYFIEVRPGENLVSLAEWASTTPTELARLNGVEVQDTLFAGQSLGLSLEGEAVDAFVEARDQALDARVDRYIDRRGGLYTVESHAIRQGETAWGVGQKKGEIPLWVLAAFNQDVELSALSIGDLLSVPVLEDTIQASAELTQGPPVDVDQLPKPQGEAF